MIENAAETRVETIARLNDRCRQGLDRTARITVTRTCLATLSTDTLASEAVAQARLLQECQPARDVDPRSAPNIDPAMASLMMEPRNVGMGVRRRRV
jgi:hypothetical protein